MGLIIRNGRIIDGAGRLDMMGDLLVSGGIIVKIGALADEGFGADTEVVDASGLVVCPGFIDLHCHLREPGLEHKETIATGTAAAARGGFTTVCCMPNTNPPIDSPEVVHRVQQKAVREGKVRVMPIGCVTQARQGKRLADLAALRQAGVVAFSDDGSPVWNAELMRRALEYSKEAGVPIIDHCEDLALFGNGVMNEGAVAARLGYKGIPAAAEERMVARDIEIARQTGGWIHIAHVSTAGSVDLIRRAKKEGVRVTAEVTPHHLTLTEDAVLEWGSKAKVNPPLRTSRDIEALVDALREGVIDAIATDHAPHAAEDKTDDFARSAFGISCLETALGSLMTLVHGGKIDLPVLISRLVAGPAEILGLPDLKGSLQAGLPADITIFDPQAEWTVDPAKFASKGKNTPLEGATMRGKVKMTIESGEIVFRDGFSL